jgi:hypothetical protein
VTVSAPAVAMHHTDSGVGDEHHASGCQCSWPMAPSSDQAGVAHACLARGAVTSPVAGIQRLEQGWEVLDCPQAIISRPGRRCGRHVEVRQGRLHTGPQAVSGGACRMQRDRGRAPW